MRKQDNKHLNFIRSLPCSNCSSAHIRSQAAHIRSNTGGGMGLKPESKWCVPLCHDCHINEQHRVGEAKFWGDIDKVKQYALALYDVSGSWQDGVRLVLQYRRERCFTS